MLNEQSELANLLDLWREVTKVFGDKKGVDRVKALVSSSTGRDILARVIRVARAMTVPKMRAIREGVSSLGLQPDQLLTHGIGKCLYGVPLVRNLKDYLLGLVRG